MQDRLRSLSAEGGVRPGVHAGFVKPDTFPRSFLLFRRHWRQKSRRECKIITDRFCLPVLKARA
jgi:hypothetical protein